MIRVANFGILTPVKSCYFFFKKNFFFRGYFGLVTRVTGPSTS